MLMSAKRAVAVCNKWELECVQLRLRREDVLLPIRLNKFCFADRASCYFL
jgi:hypothetical protein